MGTNDFLGSGWTRRRWLQTLAAAAATSALSSLAAPAPGVTEMRFAHCFFRIPNMLVVSLLALLRRELHTLGRGQIS